MTPIVFGSSREFSLPQVQRDFVRWNIYFGFAVLAVGVTFGIAQAFGYVGLNTYKHLPGIRNYYQGLTIHGVFNTLVLTTAFSNGFIALSTARGLGRPLNGPLLFAALWSLILGSLLAAYAMFSGQASVLYTFYPPLQAHWTFYLGLTLAVISTWLVSAAQLVTLGQWRKDNPGERIPLLAFMAIVTYVMWDLASVGIAAEVVLLLLPWSLGILAGADPLLSRTLFWLTGHPIVYFWLLPVYVSWYGMIPRQVGGVLFSDKLTRIVFLAFILLVPVGLHHQYVDPGISQGLKYAAAVLTFGIFFPSLMTAFAVMYALEIGGRARGGTGLVGWFWRIPWSNPSVSAQVLAMVMFLLGGISGMLNASFSMNLKIHNTAFVTGHFHETVSTAVVLSYFGIAYWMVPYLEQKELRLPRLAVFQAFLYFAGVLIFSNALIAGGLYGMPRRTALALATYGLPQWRVPGIVAAVGGSMMFLGVILFFVVLVATLAGQKSTVAADIPFTETVTAPAGAGWVVQLDRLRYFVLASVVLTLAVYGGLLMHSIPPHLAARALQYP